MYKCKICGTLSSKYTEVCSRCNGTEIEQIPDNTYVGNSIRYNSPEYNIYVPYTGTIVPQKPSVAGKVLGIISMVLGIEGFSCSVFAILFGLFYQQLSDIYDLGSSYYGSFYNTSFDALSSLMSLVVTAIVSAIVAICLASTARKKGNDSKLPTVGKIFSFITFGVIALAFTVAVAA
jgi:hypothetical protein